MRRPRRPLLALLAISLIAGAAAAPPPQCDARGPRAECGWNGIPASECLSKGCCHSPAPTRQGDVALRLPSCFRPNGGDSSYRVKTSPSPPSTIDAAGQTIRGTLSQVTSAAPALGPDLPELDFSLSLPSRDVARLTIGKEGRWRVPATVLPGAPGVVRREGELSRGGGVGGTPLEAEVASSSPFAVVVRRRGGGNETERNDDDVLVDTRASRLVFKDRYVELTTRLPRGGRGVSVYGLGERTSSSETLPLKRNDEGIPLTLWARDAAAADADQNSYGSWPVAWLVSDSGETSALAMVNSNAIDVVLGKETLTWRLTGGEVDLYALSGPTPALVAAQLSSLVGRPTLQPPWAFGVMNSKYGYASAAQCRSVVDSFDAAGVPLEAWVSDSQYMSRDRIFTWSDDFTKSEMRDFVRHLKEKDRRWVPILDPVVRVERGYGPYDEAVADGGVFVRGVDGKPYLGQMWPGAVHWPDFLDNEATRRWWTRWIGRVRDDVGAVDGIWLDMNEVSNFCSGDVCRPPLSPDSNKRLNPEQVPPNANFVCVLECEFGPFEGSDEPKSTFDPPYKVNSAGGQRNLSEKTLPVSARHPATGASEYDAHNLYGHAMAQATSRALAEVNKNSRPFLYTRSSFLGTGAFSGHWTGDTSSSWRDLRRLTPSVLLSGLAALVPFVGGDVGGFMNGASSELASRWIAAASMHPFFRFHHAQGFQEPFRRFEGSYDSGNGTSEWGPVRDAARASIGARYRLLPTLYSAAAQATSTGCPTARPLWFAWPSDSAARLQAGPYLVGDSLVVAPALEPGVESVDVALPLGSSPLFDLRTRKRVDGSGKGGKPSVVSLPAPLGAPPPTLVVGGGVVALAGEEGEIFNTTGAARAAPLTLVAALGGDGAGAPPPLRCGRPCGGKGTACGDLYFDKGTELDPGPHRKGRTLSVDASRGSVRLGWPSPSAESDKCEQVPLPRVRGVVLLGFSSEGDGGEQGKDVKAKIASPGSKPKVDAKVDKETGALELTIEKGGIQLRCGDDVEIEIERK